MANEITRELKSIKAVKEAAEILENAEMMRQAFERVDAVEHRPIDSSDVEEMKEIIRNRYSDLQFEARDKLMKAVHFCRDASAVLFDLCDYEAGKAAREALDSAAYKLLAASKAANKAGVDGL